MNRNCMGLAALFFLLSACGTQSNDATRLEQAAVQAVPDSRHGLTVTVQSQTSRNLTLIIQNGRNQSFVYWRPFQIEQQQNGVWYVIPFQKNQTDVENVPLLARPRFQTTDTIDLTRLSQTLEPGRYRAVKVFQAYSLNKQRKSVYGKAFSLAAPFTVEAP